MLLNCFQNFSTFTEHFFVSFRNGKHAADYEKGRGIDDIISFMERYDYSCGFIDLEMAVILSGLRLRS